MHDTPSRLLATAARAARAAARIHAEAGSAPRRIDSKSWRNDFVTDVDISAQEAALAVIRAAHPDHAIMAEEDGGDLPGGEGNRFIWLVDPLDGTTNFMHGHPFHAASVAVWEVGGGAVRLGAGEAGTSNADASFPQETGSSSAIPVAAAVDAQALGRVWTAARGQGAFENGEPMSVSGATDPASFLVGTGFPFKTPDVLDTYLAELSRVLLRTSGVRRTGAAAIDLAYVANGTLDGFWESRLGPWDFGAGVLLVSEAGGAVERVEGGAVGPVSGSVMAANSEQGLRELREVVGAVV